MFRIMVGSVLAVVEEVEERERRKEVTQRCDREGCLDKVD